MTTELTLAIIGIVSAPIGGWVGAILMRQKYKAEIKSLQADVDKKQADNQGIELNNVRQGNEILMEQIVKPLKLEIKYLRHDVNKFRKAVEKIPGCAHAAECPVSRELLTVETDSGDPDPEQR
jgi:hypothetical protein